MSHPEMSHLWGRLPVRYSPPPPPRPKAPPQQLDLDRFRLPLAGGGGLESLEVHTLRFGDAPWLLECGATVDAYCERHGLPLRIWGDPGAIYPTPKFCEIDMLKSFLAGDREWLLYIDADVWITATAPRFSVPGPGFWAFTNPPYKSTRNWPKWVRDTYHVKSSAWRHWAYRNMGVWACDREAAQRILDEVEPPFIDKVQEEYQFNWWIAQAAAGGMISGEMDERWNRFARRSDRPAWFYHITGGRKADRLRDLRVRRLLPQVPARGQLAADPTDDPFAIVIPWRKSAAAWDELRHSLRSIHEHFQDQDCPIYILGDERPEWLVDGGRVRFIHCPRYQDALETGVQLAEWVLWMNDDIYLLKPCGPDDFATAVHQGDLRPRLDWLDDTNSWKAGIARALIDLRHWGIEAPLYFSSHTPYLYEREMARQTLARFGVWHKCPFETLYFNQHGTPSRPLGDFRASRLPAPAAAVVLNHSDRTLSAELVAEIGDLFSQPAPWETPAAARVKFRVKGAADGPVYRGQTQVIPCATCKKSR